MNDIIAEFQGQYQFLSNFYPSPLTFDGIKYSTSEHAYQAMKTLDISERERISKLLTAGQAKRAGKLVKLRPDWDNIKDQIMFDIVKAKFQQNLELRYKLLATGNSELQEGNYWGDTYWGICRGVGQNKLGKILMKVRMEFRYNLD